MKKLVAFITILSFCAFVPKETTYIVDTKASNVHWTGKKTTGQHEGGVKLQSGQLNFNNSVPLNGEFILDMNSITVADIQDTGDNKNLVKHLKADDFFGVAKYPMAVLSITKFESVKTAKEGAPNYTTTADLTIKGIKNEIQFPARIDVSHDGATANAEITIDRTKWNIVYKSKSILGSAADKFIYDDINFWVKLVLQKQK